MIMSATTDPPSDEQKRAEFWRRARGLFRRLVNRRTLMAGFKFILWVTWIAKALRQLFSDL
jgi:hypothetical protein